MLTLLNKEQIGKYWPVIGPNVAKSLEGSDGVVMENILRLLYIDGMQCWVYVKEDKIAGIMLTTVISDEVTQCNKLLIYSIANVVTMDSGIWRSGMNEVVRFARANKCKMVLAYTKSEKLVTFAKRFGASIEYCVSIPVGGKDEDL